MHGELCRSGEGNMSTAPTTDYSGVGRQSIAAGPLGEASSTTEKIALVEKQVEQTKAYMSDNISKAAGTKLLHLLALWCV